jgi:hypothetical protein
MSLSVWKSLPTCHFDFILLCQECILTACVETWSINALMQAGVYAQTVTINYTVIQFYIYIRKYKGKRFYGCSVVSLLLISSVNRKFVCEMN